MSIHPNELMTQNQRAWNEVAARHAEHNLDETKSRMATGEAAYLDPVFRRHMTDREIADKIVVQLNCNNGRELLSVLQLGARNGVGFDFSAEFIQQAQDIATVCDVDAEFVESNVYDIPSRFDGFADIVFVTVGALCWMPDLAKYFNVARRILKPGGELVVYETHPFLEMFKLDRDREPGEEIKMHYPYFSSEPFVSTAGLDYYGDEKYGEEITYWYHYNLTDIIGAVISSDFRITVFEEFEHELDSGYRELLSLEVRPPMTFIVVADKN
ncbi:class I SAM-dependent methyltransferase [Pseudonocardia nematodicida]|uniref:Class I SAM-dependent methyltransferase n=1 Tax=Pseudonocardia nematodicida TaxID=1206997 RepID=A0ABV1KDP6_9PSEU